MHRMETFSIGRLAERAGVPTSTVRFYERIGLIKPDFRTGANYRGYTAASVDRLRFIRSAQATGLSLEDIEALLELSHATEPPCDEVLSLMRRRHGEIKERIKDLRQVEKVLAKALQECCKGEDRDICREVCRLAGAEPVGRKPSENNHRQFA
jgi:MerR family mercuric resistance operon transcriptional regulator